jgi:hypothetical protein
MSDYFMPMDVETFSLSSSDAKRLGDLHSDAYKNQDPYPFGSFDNFLPPEILARVVRELDLLPEAESSFDRPQERLKSAYSPERLPPYTRNLFYALNSRPFLGFLEQLTGIQGLIPDPYFIGGGVHLTQNGGHLDIHADFNHHGKLNLERRLNVLIYLNEDWRPEWGGEFEIWTTDMTKKVVAFTPIFNRMVCFNTRSDTWHGNPEPVNHPNGKPRISIALYYYTATWSETRKEHTTLFKPRPGTKDKPDRQVARHQLLQEVLPPLLFRKVIGRLSRLGF